MRRPDVRERVLTIVLEMLADHGVEDVEIIIATSIHRRMTGEEVRHVVGDRIFDAYWPDRLYNHDAEDPKGMKLVGTTDHGEVVELNREAVETDLLIYVNLNLVPMDGGHKSVAGRPLRLQEPPRAPQPARDARLLVVHGPVEERARDQRRAHGAPRREGASTSSTSRRR